MTLQSTDEPEQRMLPERKHMRETSLTRFREVDRASEGNPGAIKVLMYHRIVGQADAVGPLHWSFVRVNDFRDQLELLDRWGFTSITMNDYRLFLKNHLNLPRKPVMITFDDGYEDTYRFAYPVLQEYGMKAVVFVLGERKITTNFWDRSNGLPEVPLMSEQQILDMHENGFEIGAHSMTHAKLPFLPDQKAWEEISRSRMLLEILLNAPVLSFSYPYGLLNEAVKKMVNDAGFNTACSGQSGPPVFGRDQLEIRRIPVTSSTGKPAFALRMLTPYQYFDWVRSKISRALYGPYGKVERTESMSPVLAETTRYPRYGGKGSNGGPRKTDPRKTEQGKETD